MIKDQKKIEIDALPEEVFELIETMPNKFPVYKILETKPFLFLRILLTDGLHAAIETLNIKMPENSLVLNAGDSIGPFRLTDLEKPSKYVFTLRSFFFDCRTGYLLGTEGDKTILYFDLVTEFPKPKEKIWWFFVKPIHGLLAEKVLKIIKEKAETTSLSRV